MLLAVGFSAMVTQLVELEFCLLEVEEVSLNFLEDFFFFS